MAFHGGISTSAVTSVRDPVLVLGFKCFPRLRPMLSPALLQQPNCLGKQGLYKLVSDSPFSRRLGIKMWKRNSILSFFLGEEKTPSVCRREPFHPVPRTFILCDSNVCPWAFTLAWVNSPPLAIPGYLGKICMQFCLLSLSQT